MILYEKDSMTDPAVVGGKGVGLARLVRMGCRVPDFFVVTAGTDIEEERFAAEVNAFAAALKCDLFAVRSSGAAEDAKEQSFAGQFLTKLNVPRNGLVAAIREVAASGKAIGAYICKAGQRGNVAVVVQRQIIGVRSGVLFTRTWASDEELVIECVEGAGESLVGGRVTPEVLYLDKRRIEAEEPFASLAKTAVRLEKETGYPLDIEWTFSDKLYFLQVRPMTALGDNIPVIPDRKWNFYVYRDFCILCHSIQRRAASREEQEAAFGFSVPIEEGLLVNGREYYSNENAAHEFAIWKSLDHGDFFEKFIQKIEDGVKKTRRFANSLMKKDVSSLRRTSLFHIYRRAMRAYIQSYLPLMMRPDDYVLARVEQLCGAFTTEEYERIVPQWKHTEYLDEHSDFLHAVVDGDSSEYLRKYEWINNPLKREAFPLNERMFSERAANISKESARAELAALQRKKRSQHIRYVQYLETLCPEERKYVALLSRFIFLRTHTAGNSDRLFYYIRTRLLAEIAKRENLGICEICDLTYEEIEALERGTCPARLEMRKRRAGELITFFHGESRIYFGSGAYGLQKRLGGDILPKNGILEGSVACPGEARGTVKVLRRYEDVRKVEQGDIVVVSMTTPEIVSAIEKAAGIITDEGGVTCHASIIAREYAVPCLVGTKCATQVLKDGMRVYLDCIRGKAYLYDPAAESPAKSKMEEISHEDTFRAEWQIF